MKSQTRWLIAMLFVVSVRGRALPAQAPTVKTAQGQARGQLDTVSTAGPDTTRPEFTVLEQEQAKR